MLWPEGSVTEFTTASGCPEALEKVISDEGSEGIVDFVISRPGAFSIAVMPRALVINRLRPSSAVAALALSPARVAELGSLVKACVSYAGRFVAVATALGYVLIFKVMPSDDLDEVLVSRPVSQPGAGEKLGARELWLEEVSCLRAPGPVTALVSLAGPLTVVCANDVLLLKDWHSPSLVSIPGLWEPGLRAVAAGASAPLSQLAIGLSNGSVLVALHNNETLEVFAHHELNEAEEKGNVPKFAFNPRLGLAVGAGSWLYILPIIGGPANLPHPIEFEGPISCLAWSTAGSTLFVGYLDGWSYISSMGHILASQCSSPVLPEPQRAGWALASDSLLVVCDGQLRQLGNLRLASTLEQQGLQSPILAGRNRLSIWTGDLCQPHIASISTSSWLTLPFPTDVAAECCPIVSASRTADGKYVAAVGEHHLLLADLTLETPSWQTVAEQNVHGPLAWFNSSLLAGGCLDKSYELRFWKMLSSNHDDGKRRLSQIMVHTLDSAVSAICSTSDGFAIVTASRKLMLFNSVPAKIAEHDLSATILPHTTALVHENENTMYIVATGTILQLQRQENEWIPHEFARGDWIYCLENRQFVYDGQHLNCYEDGKLVMELPVEPETFLVGICPASGAAIGVEWQTGMGALATSRPVLECIGFVAPLLASLVTLGKEQEATELATKYKHLGTFEQILETMIYILLEKTNQPGPESEDTALKLGCDVVLKFPRWQHVFAGVARKTDAKFWPRLFKATGSSPARLFDAAFAENQLHTASEFLLVLHASGHSTPGDERTLALLRAAAEAGDTEMCKQLLRYLHAIDPQLLQSARDAIVRIPIKK